MSEKSLKSPIIFWLILSLAFLIASLSISYYFVIFLPSKQNSVVQIQQNRVKTTEDEMKARQGCNSEARQKAKENLEKLIASGLLSDSEVDQFKKALANGLAKKEDIDYYFNQCLTVHGLK